MKYAYYPGCSLEVNSAAYDVSVRAVADLLGVKLMELDDWNCCGATEYFSQDELTACSVIARNLALVDSQYDQLVAPCAACYLNLKKTDRLMAEHPEMNAKINEALAATKPDVVSVNTYPETHGPYAKAALEAGCHVITANKGPVAFACRELRERAERARQEHEMQTLQQLAETEQRRNTWRAGQRNSCR